MPACSMKQSDRREQLRRVGNDLVAHYGRKKFYSVAEVSAANRRARVEPDFACWSLAAFNARGDFDAYHRGMGETCDYVSMKKAMLESAVTADGWSLFDLDFDLSWLELPDIDLSIFDFFDV